MKVPSIDQTAFNCPHCGAYSRQTWLSCGVRDMGGTPEKELSDLKASQALSNLRVSLSLNTTIPSPSESNTGLLPFIMRGKGATTYPLRYTWFANCDNCDGFSIWIGERMVYPVMVGVMPAHIDTPAQILPDYNEAAEIFAISPRASAAILRVALEKLLNFIGLKGDDINGNIKNLVELGLSEELQRSMDIIRILGNESVHYGSINLNEDRTTANRLFLIFNLIVEKTITNKNMLADIYGKLPENKVNGINQRDKAIQQKSAP